MSVSVSKKGVIEGETLIWIIALLVFLGVVLIILYFNYKPQLGSLADSFFERLVG